MAAAKAVEKGYGTVFCASTGNAASSLSGMAAVSKLKSVIFVPATAPQAKLTQLQVYGSKVLAIEDSYDRAFDLSMEIGLSKGWYCRNSAINPYLLEGKKTCALELAFSMIDGFRLPFRLGRRRHGFLWLPGFEDLRRWEHDRLPVIVGVQASGAVR